MKNILILLFIFPWFNGFSEISFDVSPACEGLSNGAIYTTATGTGGPFTFLWHTGETTKDISGLAPGDYSVIITFSNRCFFEYYIYVPEITPDIISLTTYESASMCDKVSTCDGALGINVDFYGTHSIIWSNGGTSNLVKNLCQDDYAVTVTSQNGCETTKTFKIRCGDFNPSKEEILSHPKHGSFHAGTNAIPSSVKAGGPIDTKTIIKVYPNPASDKLNIELIDNVNPPYIIKLFDINGRKIPVYNIDQKGDVLILDISTLYPGIFYIEVSGEWEKSIYKFIKI